jgi:hypothetical protein
MTGAGKGYRYWTVEKVSWTKGSERIRGRRRKEVVKEVNENN